MNVIESKIAGLGFLQAIIARMANNSFYIKGWDLRKVRISGEILLG